MIDGLMDFNCMSTRLELFYTIYVRGVTFIERPYLHFWVAVSLEIFAHNYIISSIPI